MNIGFGAPRQTKLEAIPSRLKLDKTQKAEVEAILDAAQQEALPLRDALSKGREAIALALVDGRTADAALSPISVGLISPASAASTVPLSATSDSGQQTAVVMAGSFLQRSINL